MTTHIKIQQHYWLKPINSLSLSHKSGWSKLVKDKVHRRTGHESPEEEQRYSSTLSLTLALDGGGWSTPCTGRFIPGKDLEPIV